MDFGLKENIPIASATGTVFEQYQEFGFFSQTPNVLAWRAGLLRRPSIQQAVSEDYPTLLHEFLQRRNSFLSQLIAQQDQPVLLAR